MRRTAWTRRQAAWLGVAAFWPIVYVIVFLALPPTRVWFAQNGWKMAGSVTPMMYAAMALHVLTLVVTGVLVVVFTIDLASTDRIPDEQKLPWTLLLVLANVLALPAWWYFYIWSKPKPHPGASGGD